MVKFDQLYLPAKINKAPLFDALWVCHQEFKSVEKLNFSKRIFLFTDEDSPYDDEQFI